LSHFKNIDDDDNNNNDDANLYLRQKKILSFMPCQNCQR